ncbi:hypothetical protein PAHAL_5G302600 [Panicum hallii]|uniref:Uncharacterized protein n=1 Tax=Panicum hallii TaxID=206008 RepID=A0A2T8ILR9_9POAL|nr:hypothetical protein PAHAL_5G302600 [Panicum hallii]
MEVPDGEEEASGGSVLVPMDNAAARAEVVVRIDKEMLHCPLCTLSLKPPIFQYGIGHMAYGSATASPPPTSATPAMAAASFEDVRLPGFRRLQQGVRLPGLHRLQLDRKSTLSAVRSWPWSQTSPKHCLSSAMEPHDPLPSAAA